MPNINQFIASQPSPVNPQTSVALQPQAPISLASGISSLASGIEKFATNASAISMHMMDLEDKSNIAKLELAQMEKRGEFEQRTLPGGDLYDTPNKWPDEYESMMRSLSNNPELKDNYNNIRLPGNKMAYDIGTSKSNISYQISNTANAQRNMAQRTNENLQNAANMAASRGEVGIAEDNIKAMYTTEGEKNAKIQSVYQTKLGIDTNTRLNKILSTQDYSYQTYSDLNAAINAAQNGTLALQPKLDAEGKVVLDSSNNVVFEHPQYTDVLTGKKTDVVLSFDQNTKNAQLIRSKQIEIGNKLEADALRTINDSYSYDSQGLPKITKEAFDKKRTENPFIDKLLTGKQDNLDNIRTANDVSFTSPDGSKYTVASNIAGVTPEAQRLYDEHFTKEVDISKIPNLKDINNKDIIDVHTREPIKDWSKANLAFKGNDISRHQQDLIIGYYKAQMELNTQRKDFFDKFQTDYSNTYDRETQNKLIADNRLLATKLGIPKESFDKSVDNVKLNQTKVNQTIQDIQTQTTAQQYITNPTIRNIVNQTLYSFQQNDQQNAGTMLFRHDYSDFAAASLKIAEANAPEGDISKKDTILAYQNALQAQNSGQLLSGIEYKDADGNMHTTRNISELMQPNILIKSSEIRNNPQAISGYKQAISGIPTGGNKTEKVDTYKPLDPDKKLPVVLTDPTPGFSHYFPNTVGMTPRVQLEYQKQRGLLFNNEFADAIAKNADQNRTKEIFSRINQYDGFVANTLKEYDIPLNSDKAKKLTGLNNPTQQDLDKVAIQNLQNKTGQWAIYHGLYQYEQALKNR